MPACVNVSQRYVICLMGFLSIVVAYTMRGCLNLLIIEMVVENSNSGVQSECAVRSIPYKVKSGNIDWTQTQQASVLTSFFYGYIITHIPGGYISDMYGAKYVLGGAVFFSMLMTILTPLGVDYASYEVICVMRFVIGLAQGPLFPAVSTLLAKWVPKEERARAGAFVYSSALVGNVLCYFLTGLLTTYSQNWRTVFYFWGAISFFYLLLHERYCYSAPDNDPYISEAELELLRREIGPSRVLKVPWCNIITDVGCLAIMAAWMGHAVLFFFISVNFPNYLKNLLNYNLIETGLFASTPHIAVFISASIMGIVVDRIINHNWLSTLNCRRLFGFIGVFGPAVLCLLAAYFRCDRIPANIVFHLAMVTGGCCYVSVRVNSLDMTKNFAGVLSAIINGAGAIAFWPIPHLLVAMTVNNKTDEWINFYWLMTGIALIASILYVLGTKVERADWDKTE